MHAIRHQGDYNGHLHDIGGVLGHAKQRSRGGRCAAGADAPRCGEQRDCGGACSDGRFSRKGRPNLVWAGYSVMRRHDQVLYCRTEVITGQRIGTRVCLTAAQIQTEKQNVTKAKDLLNQPNYSCMGTSCNN
jgi:hypothetical protein